MLYVCCVKVHQQFGSHGAAQALQRIHFPLCLGMLYVLYALLTTCLFYFSGLSTLTPTLTLTLLSLILLIELCMYVCMYACMYGIGRMPYQQHTHTHTHTQVQSSYNSYYQHPQAHIQGQGTPLLPHYQPYAMSMGQGSSPYHQPYIAPVGAASLQLQASQHIQKQSKLPDFTKAPDITAMNKIYINKHMSQFVFGFVVDSLSSLS